jgi:hypothetical protein
MQKEGIVSIVLIKYYNMNLKIVTEAVSKAYCLREVSDTKYSGSVGGAPNYSLDAEYEAKAPREVIVGLCNLYGVDPQTVRAEIDAEKEEWENHLANFGARLEIINGAIITGQKDILSEKDYRWAVKLCLVINHINLVYAKTDPLIELAQ